MASLLHVCLFLIMLLISVRADDASALPSPSFSAIFVFGDSLLDDGNNNYLHSLAKSNFVPYGIDFPTGPTGRFSNGKIFIDLLGDLMNHPFLPAYANTVVPGANILRGVNYASAGAGIRGETGRYLGQRFSFDEQLENFATTLNQLRTQMSDNDLSQYLAKSMALVNHGSNDYINNYLLSQLYPTSYKYDPKAYAEVLIEQYRNQILILHHSGLRKFVLAAVGPLGCIPNQLSKGLKPQELCQTYVNDIVRMFNERLRSLVVELNSNYSGSIFVFADTYAAFTEILQNPSTYGFTVTDTTCCGIGRHQGICLPYLRTCIYRDQYVFWDAFHPTEAANKVLAHFAYSGNTSFCYPVNVSQMVKM